MTTAPEAGPGRPTQPCEAEVSPPVADAPRLLLSPNEAARALSVSRSKLYRLLREGHLQSVMLGGCRRIPVVSLERLVEDLLSVAAAQENGGSGAGSQLRKE